MDAKEVTMLMVLAELIEVKPNISMEELDEIILRGDLMLPSLQTVVMARDWLKKNNYL